MSSCSFVVRLLSCSDMHLIDWLLTIFFVLSLLCCSDMHLNSLMTNVLLFV